MAVVMRSFNWRKDFELVRTFLVDTYNLTHSFQNWIPSRFENIKFGPCGEEYRDEQDEYVKIWEERDGSEGSSRSKIVAVTVRESPSNYWIHIHPNYRALEKEIVLWIEKQRKVMKEEETQELELCFCVLGTDKERIALLTELGYENLGLCEYNRKRPLDLLIPEYQLPDGFTIRHVDVEKDFLQYRKVLEAVFPHCGRMTERTAKIYSTASFYNEDLDLVVVAPDGDFAAFCTVRIDPVSRIAELEPVGTHPHYRKLGLAKCVICEGLQRVQKYQPSLICITGAAVTEAANRLYDSLGFTEKGEVFLWQKKI